MRSIQSVEYYETMKKEGRSTLWTDLENMMVSERCQTYKTL